MNGKQTLIRFYDTQMWKTLEWVENNLTYIKTKYINTTISYIATFILKYANFFNMFNVILFIPTDK